MYKDWWHKISGHLGGVYPLYNVEAPDYFSLDIEKIITLRRELGEKIELDPAAIACKVSLPHLLGDRTMVRNVLRAPWMSAYKGNGVWETAALPPHGSRRPESKIFLTQLEEALLIEATSYINNFDTIGILLSGGMDSRIAAGIIRKLQLRSGNPKKVISLTWGVDNSRDVQYSQRIAKLFGWEMVHFPLSVANLVENIETAGLIGAEVSPLHLHAIPKISELSGLDAVIAASYGDSVGRAEFSGTRVTDLKPILPGNIDRYGLLRCSAKKDTVCLLNDDASSQPHLKGVKNRVRRYEIEQEMYYMRRMLQSCMLLIARKMPFYQMFTAPHVFGLMWDLDPAVRNDSWYRMLLERLPGNLLKIPWARTGRLYNGNEHTVADNFSRLNHNYGVWLRREMSEIIETRVNSDTIRRLGIFNDAGLDNALKVWKKAKTRSTNSLDEILSWIASLYVFINRYQVKADPFPRFIIQDNLNALKGRLYAEAYISVRNKMRT